MSTQSKTLYSLSKTGKPLEWTITWDDQDNWFTLTTGQVGGALTTTQPTYCKGKNIGKKNETTDITQCLAEVEARIVKQRKKDFHDEIPTKKRFEVTLAKEFNARKKFITFPMLASAKLDGFRCYITKDGMFSRTGKSIVSCPHIFQDLEKIFKVYPDLILDGELYSHDLKDDFNTMASLLTRTKNLTDDFLEKTKSIVRYNVFDNIRLNVPELAYFFIDETALNGRCVDLVYQNFKNIANDEIFIIKSEFCTYIDSVMQSVVNSFEEVEEIMDLAIEQGFEGIMLRNPNMLYEQGRSSNLIKYKRFKDSEYKVIDIQDGVGNHMGQASIITCIDNKGTTFNVGTGKGWDETAKRSLFANKEQFIGKMATIVYQDLTPEEQVPRFGKLKAFRDE